MAVASTNKMLRFGILPILACLCLLTQPNLILSATTDPPTTDTTTTTPTTTPTTTTVPTTTTTTQVQTSGPASVVPSNVDIGQCPCDLTGNACDVNCCCDTDCTAADNSTFTKCLTLSLNVDTRKCLQRELILTDNSPLTSEYDQGGLFCIYYDNYEERNYYSIPDFVTSIQTFNDYRDRYAGPTFTPAAQPATTFNQFYKYGDPVYVVYETLATGYLRQPRSLGSTQCADDNPVAYLKGESFGCRRPITSLNQNICENTDYLKASTYYQGFKVVTSTFLFSYIVNGTVVTTPVPTTPTPAPTTPSPTPTTETSNTTDSNVTTTTVTTTTVTTTTVPTTTVLTTTEAPFTINLYNNSYTIELSLQTNNLECRDTSGNIKACGFTSPPDPTYTGTTCSNIVSGVEYILTHDGTTGIVQAEVKLVFRDYNDAALPIAQTFTSTFQSSGSQQNVTERSGNPGYVIGKPVRAGVLPTSANATVGNRLAIVESLYDLTVVKSSATGLCAQDAANRIQVNFGENVRTGCLISFNLDSANVTQYCSVMQEAIINALEGLNSTDIRDGDSRRVATFGNSDILITGDWVQIIREGFPTFPVPSTDPVIGPTCSLRMGMHIEILYAKVGALANPQNKITGIAFKYENPQEVTYTCAGSYCTPGNTGLDQMFEVSQSVTFIDISQEATGYVGEPPIFIAKVPYDFFYPFAGSAIAINPSYLTFSIILSIHVLVCNYFSHFLS
ncbi:hypothetical protein FSP39_005323 [Pinctada imbricata]|uniref:Tectonic domain-containing protein n=1 Tax=Pinctada imbricata TaxID=66713 RepID=A0AA88YMJ5_PINIB|nr:hypothetical protein FSP39_005323 [Pinctada imbricata]